MTELKVFSNGFELMIAKSVDDAWAVRHEEFGNRLDEENEFEELPHDKLIKICLSEDPSGEVDYSKPTKMKCSEWIAKYGRCYLCSREL